VVECKSAQRAAAREVPGVVERESAQGAVAREEPEVQECKSRQRAAARLNKTFEMACKYVNGQLYLISLTAYGMHPVFTVDNA
jgi:hypothetical protein